MTEPAETSQSLGRAAAAGTLWLVAQKWAVRVTGLASIAILTRLVTPEEFGVVAVASSVIPFVLMLSELGVSAYIVQAAEVGQRRLSTALWFSVGVAVLLGGGLALAAPVLARLTRVPAATPVLQALAASVVIVVLGSVPTALLRRAMAFRKLALQTTVAALIAQIGAVALALGGAGAWALVFQMLLSQAIGTALAWRSARWRPTLEFSRTELREIGQFGVSVVSVEVVVTLRTVAENAVVAVALGPVALGYLNIAQRLIQVMQDLGATAVLPVSTVVFAKIRDTVTRLRGAYVRSLRIAYFVVGPLLGFVVVSAPILVPTLFGPEWTQSVVATQGLAIAAIATLGAGLDHGLFDGLGRPGTWFLYALPVEIVAFAVTLTVVHRGIDAVAWGFAGVAAASTIARGVLVSRAVAASPGQVLMPVLTALIPASVSAGVAWSVLQLVRGLPGVLALGLGITAAGVAHLVLARFLLPHVIADLVNLVPLPGPAKRLVARFAPAVATPEPSPAPSAASVGQ